jgi:hypothetical protein
MKIKTENNTMRIDDLSIAHLLFGLIFAGVGVALFFVIPFVYNEFQSYFPLIFLAAGGLVVATWSRLNVVMDKNSGKMTLTRKGLIKKQAITAELSEMKSVEYRKDQQMTFKSSSSRGSGPRMRITETVTLISSKAGMIPLMSESRDQGLVSAGMGMLGGAGASKTLRKAQEISSFLGVPLNEKNPVAEAAAEIKSAVGLGKNPGQI